MIRIHITKKDGTRFGIETNTQEEADAAKAKAESSGVYGKPQRWLTEAELNLEGLVKDGRQQLIGHDDMGAELIQYLVEAEYTIVVEDITAQVEAERVAKEAKVQARSQRLAALKAFNIDSASTLASLKPLLKALRDELTEDI